MCLVGQSWEFSALCNSPGCELPPVISEKSLLCDLGCKQLAAGLVTWDPCAMPEPRHHWTQTEQTGACLHLAVSTDHTNGGRARFGKSVGIPVGLSTRLQTNLLGNGRAAGAVRRPLFPEFAASPRFLPVLTCLQASQLWQFNWCGEGEAVGSRQGWPVFWKKTAPLGWGHGTMTDGLRAVFWQVRSLPHGFPISSFLDWWGQCCAFPLFLSAPHYWGTESFTGRPSAERRLMQKIRSGFTARLSSLPF